MNRKFLSWLPTIIVIAGLGALLVYGYWPTPVEVDVAEVTKGAIEITVDDDGETRIREKYIISSPVSGKMLRVQIHAGDNLKQGVTELARIEPSTPELLDARTKAECEAKVRVAESAQEQARAVLKRTREALELAEHEYARAKKLIASRAISSSEFDTAEHSRNVAKADVITAESGVKVSQFELEMAKVTLSRFDNGEPSTDPVLLVAPIDGQVLRVFREDASVVSSGVPLLELGDPSDLEIEIDVLSTDAVRIQPRNKMYIEHWGGANPLEAVVRLVEPSAFLKVSALGVEEKRVNVIADFVDPPDLRKNLGDGFRIEARIVVATTSEDAMKVASGALFRDGDLWFAYRIVDGVVVQTAVQTGQTNGLETEILSGLSAGDQVILHPTRKIQDGISVRKNR